MLGMKPTIIMLLSLMASMGENEHEKWFHRDSKEHELGSTLGWEVLVVLHPTHLVCLVGKVHLEHTGCGS